ncbi:MAG TPA: hypothetical protein VF875_08925 [Anaeromyxobacter sp.]
MPDPLDRLAAEGLVRLQSGRARTTPRWQATMARAALGLQQSGAPWKDLRLPVVTAMIERFPDATDEEIADLVEAMVAVEEAELAPLWGGTAPR